MTEQQRADGDTGREPEEQRPPAVTEETVEALVRSQLAKALGGKGRPRDALAELDVAAEQLAPISEAADHWRSS